MNHTSRYRTIIEPGRIERNYWQDIWHYRELFAFLAWRDILVRYKQTVFGIAWSVIRPLSTMIVFIIVFGKIAKLSSGGVPYPILVFTALLPWQFFSSSLSEASNSLISNANLFTKVYFPRLVMPASSVMVNFVDFLISFAILVLMMIWYQFIPSWRIIMLPLFFFLAIAVAMGAGLWLASLNVKYRDFRSVVPFIVQFGLFISPVGFSSNVVPERWRFIYSLNPMVGVIDGFRWAILGGESNLYWPGFAASGVIVIILCFSGIWYFRKMERTFADVI